MQYKPDKPEPTLAEQDQAFILDEIKSDECQCGKPKQPGRAFCFRCYGELPDELRRGLYLRAGTGLVEAYEEAFKYLTGECV